MANPKTLRPRPPWKPGESGNPKGRPKGVGADALLKQLTQEIKRTIDPITGKRRDMTIEEGIGWQLISKALRGDLRAIELYYERTQGKPLQKIETEPNEAMSDLNRIMREIQESNGNGNGTKRQTVRDTKIRHTK